MRNNDRHPDAFSIRALSNWKSVMGFCLVSSLGIASLLGSSSSTDSDDESALLWHNNMDGVGTSPAI